ncbi:hypothetical protein CERSUDRAFT_118811 [Gelatoporia subvermispora B]|uniref:Uncharacterized protein n=1 Tax=Ceriporiopsis subvermispora (strain B) TaxID=914234 RepID=M2P9P0_CERS8|nr:hypothetical protein CERSUDRAFT_118811 [Gelatoporia subvermispora B]
MRDRKGRDGAGAKKQQGAQRGGVRARRPLVLAPSSFLADSGCNLPLLSTRGRVARSPAAVVASARTARSTAKAVRGRRAAWWRPRVVFGPSLADSGCVRSPVRAARRVHLPVLVAVPEREQLAARLCHARLPCAALVRPDSELRRISGPQAQEGGSSAWAGSARMRHTPVRQSSPPCSSPRKPIEYTHPHTGCAPLPQGANQLPDPAPAHSLASCQLPSAAPRSTAQARSNIWQAHPFAQPHRHPSSADLIGPSIRSYVARAILATPAGSRQ